jgi:hypothetical protein
MQLRSWRQPLLNFCALYVSGGRFCKIVLLHYETPHFGVEFADLNGLN